MKKKKYLLSISFIIILLTPLIFLLSQESKIKCTKYGDFIIDKILNISTDCYERKLRGVIFPSIKFIGPRYNILNDKINFECPSNSPVIILSGQSNSANFLKSNKKFKNSHFNFYDGKCYNLSSPSLGAEGEMSSLAPSIANKITSNKKFIFITSGRGGISIEDASILNNEFIKYNLEALRLLNQKNNYLKYFIWIHGESNNKNNQNYLNKFKILYEEIIKNQKNKPKLIITNTSICKNERDYILNEIQKEISIKYSGISKLIDTDSLSNDYRYDQCHFNQKGLEKISDNISNLINNLENE